MPRCAWWGSPTWRSTSAGSPARCYGVSGTYRNCGSTPYREEHEIRSCRQAEQVWYGVGGQSPPPGEAGARATFNPHYADLERRIGEFLGRVDGRDGVGVVSVRGAP
jgi:hypothetical protein